MSLEIGDAVKGGFARFAGRTGAILAIAYLAVYLVYQTAFNTLVNYLYAQIGLAVPPVQPSFDPPLAVAGGIVAVCLVAMSYLTLVSARTFVADARSSFPAGAFSRNLPFALANLVVGGLVFAVLTWVGFILLIVPGLFLVVSLLFMPIYVAVEDENFVSAFRRSWALTSGERLSVFLLLLVLFAVGFAAGIAVGILGVVAALAGGGQAMMQIFQVLVIAPITIFNLAVIAVAYEQLRDDEGDVGPDPVATDAPTSPA